MDKRFLTILAVLAAIFVGIFLVTQNSGDNKSGNSSGGSQATNHVIGEGKKGVTFIEYGDFQCPVCLAYEPVMQQVRQKYSADIRFQFRNLPLSATHPNAFAAARAAEAAGLQDKYWQMHDALYAPPNWQNWTQSSSPISLFESYAKQLGLNVDKFKQDYASGRVNDAVNADLAAFTKTGQEQATPTFFVNGKYVPNTELADDNGPSLTKISKVIDDAIAEKASSGSQ